MEKYKNIYFVVNAFFPPLGVLLTLSNEEKPNWSVLQKNLILTLFGGIFGSRHAVSYFNNYLKFKSQERIAANKTLVEPFSIKEIYQRLRKSNLSEIQINLTFILTIVSIFVGLVTIIATILAVVISINTLFFGGNAPSGNQTPITSNISEKSSYVCSISSSNSLRYKLKYKNVPPNLRYTPETNENNIRVNLKNEYQLIYLASNGKWHYVCIEGTSIYGWVYSQNVEIQK